MTFVTGEVVPTSSGALRYKVVFKFVEDGSVVSEWPVASIAEGEAQIALALRSIEDAARERSNGSNSIG